MSAGTPEVAAARRKSREHGSDADSGGRAATPVARCAALRVRPTAPAARETVQPAGASEGEAARRRSGGGRPQQQQKAAGKQRTTAGRCEREQIARTANAAHQEESAKSYDEMRRACAELCLGTEKFLEPLNRALKGDSVKAIKSHREALLSEVERIEGAAAREAQARGQDLNEVKELMRRMLTRTQDTLRAADITLCKWKAAHHAACIEDLADEAFEAQDGTREWSAQECTDFRKELDWELQAFRKANTKLELRLMETDERRAERVETAARRAREVVEKVLWDRRSRWESIHPGESCGQGDRRGVQAGSVAGETEDAPEELLQGEPADPAEHWLGETEDAPGELPLTAQEPGEEAGQPGVETGHSEVWASESADLAQRDRGCLQGAAAHRPGAGGEGRST